MQATTDPGSAGQLVYNADGYYTYTFSTDITDPTKTNGVVYEPGRTHRVAIQLAYKNAAGQDVKVNLPLIGAYQAANALVSAGLALATFGGITDAGLLLVFTALIASGASYLFVRSPFGR